MTPQQAAAAITGAVDDGGVCTPNSPMGRARQIAQAIEEAIAAERERCAEACERVAKGYRMSDGSSTFLSLAVDKATAAIRALG